MTSLSKNRPIEGAEAIETAPPNNQTIASREDQLLDLPPYCCDLDEYDAHVAAFAQRLGCAAFLLVAAAHLLRFFVSNYFDSLIPIPMLMASAAFILAGRAAIEHDLFVLSTQRVYGSRSKRDELSSQIAFFRRTAIAVLCVVVGVFLWMMLVELDQPSHATLVACPFVAYGIALTAKTVAISWLYDHESFNERQEQRLSALDVTCEEDVSPDEPDIESSPLRDKAPSIIRALAIATVCSILMWIFGRHLCDTCTNSLMIAGVIMCCCVWLPFIYPCAVIATA